MNTIKVRRLTSDGDTTLGIMNAFDVVCGTLEDEHRDEKVAGETRIPAGRYEIKLRTDSPMADKYRARYGEWHRGMLWLQNVPGFEWVYIHTGNTDDHTEGCILVGYSTDWALSTIGASRVAYEDIARKCMEILDGGGSLFIDISDED